MKKNLPFVILIAIFLACPISAQASDGIPLQKDIFLGSPILSAQDLPETLTFVLYDSKTGTTPLGFQTFSRGEYNVDFEFSKSNGISAGNVARVNAEFTGKLNVGESQPREIWAAIEVGGAEIGDRAKVSDETLVRLLLASNASIASYLTLVYEGDDNPIATIYKDLPLSAISGNSSESDLSAYFSAIPTVVASGEASATADTRAANWIDSGSNVYITGGRVGIGTSNPGSNLHVFVGTSGGTPYPGAAITFEDDISAYFQFLSSSAGYNAFMFGDPADIEAGAIYYNHLTDTLDFRTNGHVPRLLIDASGNVGIGTTNPTYPLCVNGTIRAKEIIVDTGWSDFVFENNYKLPALEEVETFISENKHLPGIPTEAEVKKKGVSVGKISSKLLQKIEELTLYMIDLKKEVAGLKKENESLRSQQTTIQQELIHSGAK